MAHVELSVSGPNAINMGHAQESSLERWTAAVLGANEYCLVLDANAVVVAISPPFARLLGLDSGAVGREVFDGVLDPVDFADGGSIPDAEASKIPPLLALTSGRLARGLLRVSSANGQYTLDAVAAPLVSGENRLGSLTFFSRI